MPVPLAMTPRAQRRAGTTPAQQSTACPENRGCRRSLWACVRTRGPATWPSRLCLSNAGDGACSPPFPHVTSTWTRVRCTSWAAGSHGAGGNFTGCSCLCGRALHGAARDAGAGIISRERPRLSEKRLLLTRFRETERLALQGDACTLGACAGGPVPTCASPGRLRAGPG
jgi:hypothetical protein